MELSQKSWHAISYRMAYQTSPPNSLCPYFWKSLFTFFMLPFTWYFVLAHVIFYKITKRVGSLTTFLGFPITLAILLAGMIYSTDHFPKNNMPNIFMIFIYGAICISIFAIAFCALILICFAISTGIKSVIEKSRAKKRLKYLLEHPDIDEDDYYNTDKPSWFREGIRSFFQKYCPRITWKDTDEYESQGF